ncbi:MAG: ABC transporter ATP-binding protein, partial [Solirubrobacteraceae bacterium]
IVRRVGEILEIINLSDRARARPRELSGGQQQRVALARALVNMPALLLLDEPLGALDARIRKQLRVELKAVQEEVGITFVFVTHDQEEALSMSDRLAVMSNGRVEQVGTPVDVYENPATVFVAEFLGASNLMSADVAGHEDRCCVVRVGDFVLRARGGDVGASGAVKIVVRPERVTLTPHAAGSFENALPGMVERTVYVGASVQVIVRLATGATMQATIANTGGADAWTQGTPVLAQVPADALRVLAPGAGEVPQEPLAAVGG